MEVLTVVVIQAGHDRSVLLKLEPLPNDRQSERLVENVDLFEKVSDPR